MGRATSVWVSGDWNGWPESAIDAGDWAMGDISGTGTWRVSGRIGPGRHLYKLVVDGAWIADPSATEQESDGFGGFNSVVEVCGVN